MICLKSSEIEVKKNFPLLPKTRGRISRTKHRSFMSIAHIISSRNRQKKWKKFLNEFSPNENQRVLDLGFSEKEYSKTDNFIEKHYPYPSMLTALGLDAPDEIIARYPEVNFIQYDGKKIPFADKDFDICWSNAVIEHVGNHDDQLNFLKEIKRVSRYAFVTTPNKHFPIEIHTRTPLLHFLPKPVFDKYLWIAGKSWATCDYMQLLSKSDVVELLNEAEIASYRIYKNRFLGFIMDFAVVFKSD